MVWNLFPPYFPSFQLFRLFGDCHSCRQFQIGHQLFLLVLGLGLYMWQERYVEKLQCFGFPRWRCPALSANFGWVKVGKSLNFWVNLSNFDPATYLILSPCFFDDHHHHHPFPNIFPKVFSSLPSAARQDLSCPTP